MKVLWVRLGITLLVFLTLGFHSWSQEEASEDLPLTIESASLSPHHGPAQIQRTLKIRLQLKQGFKAYVDKFKLNILEPDPIKFTDLKFEPVLEFYDKFSKSKRQGVKDQAVISTTIEIQRKLEDGPKRMTFELRFQACSETVCYFPQTIKKDIDFVVATLGAPQSSLKPSMSLLEESFANAQKRGLPYLFIFVFLAGILTSLTPCLLPMLPLTIAVIGKGHGQDSKGRKFINALTYVMGIATTYSILGVLAASSGALFGGILSNVWVQVGFGVAFILMGLAQFGFFEFQTPLFLQNRFHKIGSDKKGIYITGLLSGFIASPCVGPVLVGILTFIAQSQDRVLGFWLMFAYALGLGQLLIILGVSSSLLYRFPKAPWIMKTSKTFLGLALIASGLFYLSLLWPSKIEIKTGPVAEVESASKKLNWKSFSEELLAEAKANHKPVLIDFFADWCLACHELDEKTFGDEGVQSALNNFTLLRFNATDESPELEKAREKYGIVGLPTILFYNSQGEWVKEQTLNEFESSELFIQRIQKIP